MIIFAHYFMCNEFSDKTPYFCHALSYDIAILSVSLFLVISGYLIPASLERSPTLWQFYKHKFIRIVVPFTVSYLLLTAGLILPALFGASFSEQIPLIHFLRGGKILPLILGMFPIDFNAIKIFGWGAYWFVGEWFMGMLLWLYLLSPFLCKAAKKFPRALLITSIVVAYVTYYATQPLEARGTIHESWSLFIVRAPEFLFGMILSIHRDKIQKKRLPLSIAFMLGVTFSIIYFIATLPPGGALFFATNPNRLVLLLPLIYLLFVFAELFNYTLPIIFTYFNGLNALSYVAMIIQHAIIYLFATVIDFYSLNSLAIPAVLLLIVITIFVVSKLIKDFSDRVERAMEKIL